MMDMQLTVCQFYRTETRTDLLQVGSHHVVWRSSGPLPNGWDGGGRAALWTVESTFTQESDEKLTEEASTSGASSGSESPGSPTPLVPDHVVEVNHNGISLSPGIKHSPLFRTRLPHLSAHQLALTAGARRQRYQSPYAPKGQYAQPQSYNKWSKQRQTSRWTRRRRLERPLLWLASAILICLLIAGIMIAVFWVSGSSSNNGGTANVLGNTTNTTISPITTAFSTVLGLGGTNVPTTPLPTPTGVGVNQDLQKSSTVSKAAIPTSNMRATTTTTTVKPTTKPTTTTIPPTLSTRTTSRSSTSSSTVIAPSSSPLSTSTLKPTSSTTSVSTSTTKVPENKISSTISMVVSSTKVQDSQRSDFSLLPANRTQTFPDNKNATEKPP